MSPKTRYIMVGGFLGAGKTTAILNVAETLRRRGLRVGLITNDQSYGLVDTAMLFKTVLRAFKKLVEIPPRLRDANHRNIERSPFDHGLQRRKNLLVS